MHSNQYIEEIAQILFEARISIETISDQLASATVLVAEAEKLLEKKYNVTLGPIDYSNGIVCGGTLRMLYFNNTEIGWIILRLDRPILEVRIQVFKKQRTLILDTLIDNVELVLLESLNEILDSSNLPELVLDK